MTDCKSVTSLPESFCDLKSLKTLTLRGYIYIMGLVSLPERFGQLRSLVTLNLSGCNFEALPAGIPPCILPLSAALASLFDMN